MRERFWEVGGHAYKDQRLISAEGGAQAMRVQLKSKVKEFW